MQTPGAASRRAVFVSLLAFGVLAAPVLRAQDLWIPGMDQSNLRLNVIADPQCPITCGGPDIPCCATFAANIVDMNTRVPDLTMLNGDLTIDSHDQIYVDQFLDHWDDVVGEKHFVLGNHEADPHENFTWADPEDHYVPAVQHEPLFGYGTPEYRRWYSIYLGSPPRVAVFALNNCSDSYIDDEICYLFCSTPNDLLNHAGSPQREWLESEIDALPPTIVSVLVCLHRSYYGVENYLCRPNVLYSSAEFAEAPQETLRTGAVSFLRVLESIPSRSNVQRVIVASGDQHCFAITRPIRQNVRDDENGIPYIVLGGGGAKNNRSAVYPAPNKIPNGLLVGAFDDKWFNTTFQFKSDEIRFTVREAYSDSLLHESAWPLEPVTGAPVLANADDTWDLELRPNPVSRHGPAKVSIELRAPGPSVTIDRLSIVDIAGRRLKRLAARGEELRDGDVKTWNLRDDAGNRVAPGVYLVVARSGSNVATKKIVVLE